MAGTKKLISDESSGRDRSVGSSISALDFAAAATSDIFSAFQIPGAAVLSTAVKLAIQSVQTRKAEEARAILLEEIRQGATVIQGGDIHESAAILFRYARAAHEGAGRLNLRLLAAVYAGQMTEKAVFADEFYRWADVLVGLTKEEIAILAAYLRHTPSDPATNLVKLASRVFQDVQGIVVQSWEEFDTVRGMLLRTGLLSLYVSGGAINGGSSVLFAPTSRLQELGRLVEFEALLARDRGL